MFDMILYVYGRNNKDNNKQWAFKQTPFLA